MPECTACTLTVRSVPLIVTGVSRNRWLLPVLQVHRMIVALSAVEAPLTSTHTPETFVAIVYWSVVPSTEVKVNR